VGATSLLTQGRDRIGTYADAPHDIDIAGLMRWADLLVAALDRGESPVPTVPHLTHRRQFT
jgi:hypothetical protein